LISHARADALRADLGAPVDPAVIAVLLPSSGRFAAIGDELAAAIKLADPQGAKLVFLDTGGDEAKAAAAVDRAAALGAIAILGPVGEHEALAAARRAAERAIPIALLAPGDGADPSSGVFRLVTSPAAEARMAADFAAQESYPTVAVLAPRDDVGDAMAEAFRAEAVSRGLAVTADGRYDPTASNLEPDVKAFLGLDPATNEKLAAWLHRHGRKGWQTFVPDVPFSLLYVPDQYDRASLVAAYLPYLGVELRGTEAPDPDALKRKYHGEIPQVVQLLGSSGWNHPALVTRGGDAVAGAMIIDVFAGDRDQGPAAELSQKFHDATGRDPSSAAAQAYDAARIVFAARHDAGTRAAFAAALARAHLDDGACGAARLDEGGAIVRAPVVLQVDGGELALVPY
jgi:ABC-type branched-subunit amino acid transport system substrate-binding protein